VVESELQCFTDFIDRLAEQNDWITVVTSIALLEQQLHDILLSRMPKQQIPHGLQAQTDACLEHELLGPSEAQELIRLHQIHQEFAHTRRGMTFHNPQIQQLCLALYDHMPVAQQRHEERPAKARFMDAILFTSLALRYRPIQARLAPDLRQQLQRAEEICALAA
jgi:hypothetical protein